jgi:hypothetical protein
MFNLNEYITSISLESINLITLKYYSSKSDIMNIYDTNFEFDENIVPLITSVLELKPNIINAKRYCNINSESIITISNENELPNKSQLSYPCFFSDIQQNKLNSQNIQGYTHNLINTIQLLEKAIPKAGFRKSRAQIKGALQLLEKAVPKQLLENSHAQIKGPLQLLEKAVPKQLLENSRAQIKGARGAEALVKGALDKGARGAEALVDEALVEKSFLIRMYKLENKKGEFNLNILNEEEIIIILWNLEFANFQIIINKKQPKICQMQINIYITEDNNIIVSKLEQINKLIDKINKIINNNI